MLIYLYSNDGTYLNSQEITADPLRPDIYIMPVNSTKIKPPVIGEYQIILFENGGWRIKSNYVGVPACEIDANSIFVQLHTFTIGEVLSPTIILAPAPTELFYKTKWNGTTWVEGATQAEIDAIVASTPKTLKEIQDITIANQGAIDFIIMNS